MSSDVLAKSKTLLELEPEEIYFDRSPEIEQALLKNLLNNFFVSITGESGSGKSTLANITLVKALETKEYAGRAGTAWRVVRTRPLADPIGNLAKSLSDPGGLFRKGTQGTEFRQTVARKLRENSSALENLYTEEVEGTREPFNLLIIVDQMQDLYRYRKEAFQNRGQTAGNMAPGVPAGDDALFIHLCLNAFKSTAPIYVVFVADSRNFEYFSQYRGLPEAMNNFRFQAPAIKTAEISAFFNTHLPAPTAGKTLLLHHKALEDQLLKDFQVLAGKDPDILQKLNLSLCLVLAQWKKSLKSDTAFDPVAYYGEIGSMKSVITWFVTGIYEKCTPDQKMQVEALFKALTEKGGANDYLSRPATLGELQKLIQQDKTVSFSDIKNLLDRFNAPFVSFILTPESSELYADAIVDINSDALLPDLRYPDTSNNWPRLTTWVDLEANYANVYFNLVHDALNYFVPDKKEEEPSPAPPQGNQRRIAPPGESAVTGKTTDSSAAEEDEAGGLYKGATLFSAKKWKARYQNNQAWAERYLPELPEVPEEKRAQLQQRFPDKEVTNLFLARQFLDLSIREYDNQQKQKEEDLKKARRQRTQALILALASVVLGIVAGIFWYQAREARQNIELIDFVEVLGSNGVLDFQASNEFEEMNQLIDSVVRKKSINDQVQVLNFLNAKHILNVDTTPAIKDLSYAALLNIDALFHELKTGVEHDESLTEIKKICQTINTGFVDKNNRYRQFPYVYHALLAHVNQLKLDLKPPHHSQGTAPENAQVEERALIPNPKKPNEYAYGDKNGNIFLKSGGDTLTRLFPNVGDVVRSLGFSRDGHSLWVGTRLGNIFRYDSLHRPPGVTPSMAPKKAIYADSADTVYFVREWDTPDYILVGSTTSLYFVHLGVSGAKLGKIKFPLVRVGYTDWTPDHQWFIVSGKDTTLFYHLDPTNKNPKKIIERTACLIHPGITMTNHATKIDTLDGAIRLWLALGSEKGDVWFNTFNLSDSLFYSGAVAFNSLGMKKCPEEKKHDSPISGLKFNPGYPQLAAGSFNGQVRLWNLEKFEGDNSDDILLSGTGQSINSINYISASDLVVRAGLYNWEIKTTIKALEHYLDQLFDQWLCKQNKCK